MLQHVEAHHRVETLALTALKIPMHRQAVRQAKGFGAVGNKRLVVGIEVDKPDVVDRRHHRGSRQRMGADATTEIEHLATGKLLLKAQGVSDVSALLRCQAASSSRWPVPTVSS